MQGRTNHEKGGLSALWDPWPTVILLPGESAFHVPVATFEFETNPVLR